MAIFIPHSNLAKLLGTAELRSSAPTVGALLDEVRGRVAPEDWTRASRATVLVNGRNVHALSGRDTPLRPEDEVWMVFPAAGG